jgi:exopolyphosphatase/guanosine-5'-triphosphate,3'-diphosphate pyrophosphatase
VKKGLRLDADPLVIDLGGGSTEFISNDASFSVSLPIGAVRASEEAWTHHDILQRLQTLSPQKKQFESLPVVFAGGTASSLVAVKLALEPYDSEKVHGQKLSIEEVKDLCCLLENTPLELRRRLPGLQPERADIINQGAAIVFVIMAFLGKLEIHVSEHDLLQGMLYEID